MSRGSRLTHCVRSQVRTRLGWRGAGLAPFASASHDGGSTPLTPSHVVISFVFVFHDFRLCFFILSFCLS